MNPWKLVYDGFDPAGEGVREALCTLGNGYFATRGAAPDAVADGVHYPGTYLAGCYDRLTSAVAGRTVTDESMVNAPNWLPLTFATPDSDWFATCRADLLGYRQELDLRHGLLDRRLLVRDAYGRRTAVRQRRLVSMDDPHLATSRDHAGADARSAALRLVRLVPPFPVLLARHRLAWDRLWTRARLDLGDLADAHLLHLHTFHLLQTLSPHSADLDVGVPARGLHGEAYRGHVFWDELFVLPWLNVRFPEISRAALRYRHRRLPEARAAARDLGIDIDHDKARIARADDGPAYLRVSVQGRTVELGREAEHAFALRSRPGMTAQWPPRR